VATIESANRVEGRLDRTRPAAFCQFTTLCRRSVAKCRLRNDLKLMLSTLWCGQLTQPSGASARFDASSEGSLAFDRLERRFGLCCLMPEQSPTDVVATISERSVFRRKIA
jgi:hypothetical protein